MTCVRYFGIVDPLQVYNLGFREYYLMLEGLKLRWVDEDYRRHQQAYLNFSVQATDSKSRPVYKTFDKFYDYRKAQNLAKGVKEVKHADDPIERIKNYYRSKK